MRHFLIGVALGGTLAAITSPVQAQVPFPPAPPPQWQDYFNNVANWPYPFPALTPWDAYRQGLINRWELEQWAGPIELDPGFRTTG